MLGVCVQPSAAVEGVGRALVVELAEEDAVGGEGEVVGALYGGGAGGGGEQVAQCAGVDALLRQFLIE